MVRFSRATDNPGCKVEKVGDRCIGPDRGTIKQLTEHLILIIAIKVDLSNTRLTRLIKMQTKIKNKSKSSNKNAKSQNEISVDHNAFLAVSMA